MQDSHERKITLKTSGGVDLMKVKKKKKRKRWEVIIVVDHV